MSNVLAIAGVTQLLKDLINDALIDGDVSQALGADFTVTALPPDRVVAENGQDQDPQLNLFLHRLTPNASLRNDDLPTRDHSGRIVVRPRLALDLHYILTAVAAEELHAEILLGYAMQLFHETAILGREQIRQALTAAGQPTSAVLPDALGVITASELADQLELIKISPQTISMDDMSKMWTALQASYRTTVAYDVSVVLIERELPTRPTTPVLSRGGLVDPATGRDPGVNVEPSVVRTVPSLVALEPVDRQAVMRLGGELAVVGTGFDVGAIEVRFTRIGADDFLTLTPRSTTTTRFTVQLPQGPPLGAGDPAAGTGDDPGSWRIGTWMVEVRITDGGGRQMVTSALPIALAPAASLSAAVVPGGVEISATVEPDIQPGQSVAVLVGSAMRLVDSPAVPTSTAAAVFDDLAAGAELPVRLRVDGIDSPVIDRLAEPPALITITVPGP